MDASISVTPVLGRPGDNWGQGEGEREGGGTALNCMSGLLSSLPPFPTWISPSRSPSPPQVSLPPPSHTRVFHSQGVMIQKTKELLQTPLETRSNHGWDCFRFFFSCHCDIN